MATWIIGIAGVFFVVIGVMHGVIDHPSLDSAQHLLLTGITLLAIALK